MQISKNNLFYSILSFLILIDILVAFDLKLFHIRSILAFLFITLVPGILIMLNLKIRKINFWEYLVYAVGLSISFIMFAGLAVNWILPWLNITDKPLSTWPILISFNLLLMGLILYARIKNEDLRPIKIKFPKLDWINRIFLIIPMVFPVLSILGALLLNNHGTNILTMIMLGGIAVYVLMIVIFRDRLNENIYHWAILMISISLLLSGSLRSWHISGWDINLEYYSFNLTNGYWQILDKSNTYNFSLSITLLPRIIKIFTEMSGPNIFKIAFQILSGAIPLIVLLISKKYVKIHYAFLSAFIFISQYLFFELYSWCRQEIAFIFFGLMFLAFTNYKINENSKKFLLITLGVSLVVSHYSTTYIALAILILAYFLNLFLKLISKEVKYRSKDNLIKVGIILILLASSFLWYSQLTPTSEGLISFAYKSASNLENILEKDVRSDRSSLSDQFNLFYKPEDISKKAEEFRINKEREYSDKINPLTSSNSDYKLTILPPVGVEYHINKILIQGLVLLRELIKNILRIALIGGIVFFMIKSKKDITEKILFLSSFGIFALIVILPFSSISYNLSRLYQQILIPLSFTPFLLFYNQKKKWTEYIMTLIIILFFLFNSNFIFQLTGGSEATTNLNNFGAQYDASYTQNSELKSFEWFIKNKDSEQFVYLDSSIKYKLLAFNKINMWIFEDILPGTIDKSAYVFSGYTNTLSRRGYLHSKEFFRRETVNYIFPNNYLNNNKNKVYNSGGSEIFK